MNNCKLIKNKTLTKITCLMLSLILAIGLMPLYHTQANANEDKYSQENTTDALKPNSTKLNQNIDQMLEDKDYIEGEVIAIVRDDLSIDTNSCSDEAKDAENLLDSGEKLMSSSKDSVEDSLSVSLPSANNVTKNNDSLYSKNETTDEEVVKTVLISNTGMSTRALLELLSNDERVITAEPNFHVKATTLDSSSKEITQENSAILNTATETTKDSTSQLSAPTTVPKDDGGLSINEGTDYYDLSSWQWPYDNDSRAFKRANDTKTGDSTLGISDWNNNTGTKNAKGVIAVIDQGVDYNNPDIKSVMVSGNNSEISQQCGGGQYGYNASNDGSPEEDCQDYGGHGTACAGIAAAAWNQSGVSGAANGAEILAVRMYTQTCAGGTGAAVRAYEYLERCADAGMNIVGINNSWGIDYSNSYALSLAVTKLGERGAISVFASSNSSLDNDVHASTVANLGQNPYSITVNATQKTLTKTVYSCYGQMTTHVYAPGSEFICPMASTNKKNIYGPCDTNPVYRNYFTDSNLSDKLWVSKTTKDDAGNLVVPKNFNDLGDFANNVVFSKENSVDAVSGSGSMRIYNGDGKDTNTNYWVALPVASQDLSNIQALSFHGYGIYNESNLERAKFKYVTINKNNPDDIKIVGSLNGSDGRTTGLDCWSANNAVSISDIDEGYDLYTLPGESDAIKYVLFNVDTENITEYGIFLDALTLCGDTTQTNSSARNWMLEMGTSMSTPAVTGCLGILAKQIEGSDDTTAIKRANYIKSHIVPIEDGDTTCTQGGTVNLSVADEDTTAVINYAKQNDDGTIVLTGDYFGQNSGTVKIDNLDADVITWTNAQVVIKANSSVTSGEKVVALTKPNNKTCRTTIPYQSSLTGQVKAFEDILQSPDTSPNVFSKIYGLNSGQIGFSNPPVSYGYLRTNTFATAQGKIFLSAIDGFSEESFPALLCYNPSTNSWQDPIMFSDEKLFGTILSSCTIASCDNLIYIYGISRSDDKCIPHFASYNPANGNIVKYDASAMDSGNGVIRHKDATLISANGEILIIGGANSSGVPMDAIGDNIGKITINADNNTISYESVGKIDIPKSEQGQDSIAVYSPKAVEHNGDIYIGSFGSDLMKNKDEVIRFEVNTSLLKLVKGSDGKWQTNDLSSSLPKFMTTTDLKTSKGYLPTYSLASTVDGIAISGANIEDTTGQRSANDTYILKDGTDVFVPYERSASLGPLFYPVSVYVDGYLYTLGSSKYSDSDAGAMLFRRTGIDICTVTFNAQGISEDPAPQKVVKGQTLSSIENPSAQGYIFKGWYKDSVCTTAFDISQPIEGSITLYAKWQKEGDNPVPDNPQDNNGVDTISNSNNANLDSASYATNTYDASTYAILLSILLMTASACGVLFGRKHIINKKSKLV